MTDLLRLSSALASRYRIERELGAGGMATVYLARDLKHDRDVAIKVLHPDLGITLGGERFLSEIKTTAKLQHPHILPLLDSGEADGLLYYVMPLMTGETLRARLERERQLPVADAVLIAREVADALAYAHGLGVIHRDIKPENILLQNGHALVADFGIALAVQAAGGTRMTQTGLSLGTPQYMSPEQAMGERTIDARSDIYALGAVTYEMLAGEPPFTGPTVQAIVARLLSEEPRSLSAQRKAIPPSVEDATLRALEKLPADRFADAQEFSAALITDAPAPRTGARHPARIVPAPRWRTVAAGLALLTAGVVLGRMVAKPAVSSNAPRHVSIALPDSMRVAVSGNLEAPGGLGSVTISGDGSRIVWVGTALVGGNQGVRLYVRDMQSYLIKAVPGSEGAFAPFLSDNGAIIGYFSGGELRTADLRSGETRVLQRDLRSPVGGAFFADGSVLVTLESSAATIVSPSGTSRQLVRSQAQDPSVAPGGISFACIVPGDRYAIGVQRGGPLQVMSIADGALRALRPFHATGSDSGSGIIGGAPKVVGQRLYWLEHDVVMMANVDVENARLTSEPSPVIDGVRGDLFGAADFDIASDGTLIFVAGGDPAIGRLAWLDDKSRVDTIPLPAADYVGFDISPDGRSLLTKAINSDGSEAIRLVDLERSTGTNLILGAGTTSQPGWSADGRAALLSIMSGGPASARIIRVPLDNRSTYDTLLTGSLARQAISRDGRLTVLQVLSDRSANIYLTGHEASKLYASTNGGPFEELPSLGGVTAPALSPDGRWIAYEGANGSRTDTFIERFPPDGRATIVAGDGGYEPIFSPKGDKLFYRRGRGVMVVELTPGDPIKLGKARSYVQFDFADFLGRGYKVGNDDRLLVKLLPSTAPQSEIRVVLGAGR